MIPSALADVGGVFNRNGLSLSELRNVHSRPGVYGMSNKGDTLKRSKAPKITHPGMMGDGTEEQNLGEKGIPKSRIKKDDVKAAFEETNPNKMP